ncbi:MAG: hypothetical protein J5I98_16595 [Phaeodactylibacter sp.]|nr:hypothetical protein [Phaeodactylibacter sp.]
MKTKILFTAALFLLPFLANVQAQAETLTNEEVITLTKIGLEPSVIVSKIQTSNTSFDVSTDGLIDLTNNGVSAEVIKAMMNASQEAAAAEAGQQDLNDPLTPRAAGIYYYNPIDKDKKLRRVDPTVVSTSQAGGVGGALKSSVTRGLANQKAKSSLAGSDSRLQIQEVNPEFYFYFEANTNAYSDNWFFATATSPNEFVLVRLDEKKNSREFVVAKANAFGGSTGIPDKEKVPFNYEEAAPGIYKVTFEPALEQGEYCFLYASSMPSQYSNDKVFDFGVMGGQ